MNIDDRVEESDADLFLYKYSARMNKDQLTSVMNKLGYDSAAIEKNQTVECSRCVESEYDLVPLPTWNNGGVNGNVTIRRDTNTVLNASTSTTPTESSVWKMLVGITTSDPRRIENLLSDLGCMLNDEQHSVVVFANSNSPEIGDSVLKMLQGYKFRGHIIRNTDRIVKVLFPSSVGCLPLPIAKARTVMQTFLHATTMKEDFDAVAVLDDDMRLPKGWGIRDEDEEAGDILLGRAIKTPPNVTAMSMRTQLLDFIHALDKVHFPHPSRGSNGGDECPSL